MNPIRRERSPQSNSLLNRFNLRGGRQSAEQAECGEETSRKGTARRQKKRSFLEDTRTQVHHRAAEGFRNTASSSSSATSKKHHHRWISQQNRNPDDSGHKQLDPVRYQFISNQRLPRSRHSSTVDTRSPLTGFAVRSDQEKKTSHTTT